MQANEAKGIVEQAEGVGARDITREAVPNFRARSKILLHFMKCRISLTPMETIMKVLKELEYLEGLVKLGRRKKNEETGKIQVTTINNTPIVKRISMNKSYLGKTMHLPVEINNGVIKGLVDIGASMSIMVASTI